MSKPTERRYTIGEVSEQTGVPPHTLRQWEAQIPQLKPRRTRANQRYYLDGDIEIVRRLNYLVRHERLTLSGARLRLAQEIHGAGRPQTSREVLDLLTEIDQTARHLERLLDNV